MHARTKRKIDRVVDQELGANRWSTNVASLLGLYLCGRPGKRPSRKHQCLFHHFRGALSVGFAFEVLVLGHVDSCYLGACILGAFDSMAKHEVGSFRTSSRGSLADLPDTEHLLAGRASRRVLCEIGEWSVCPGFTR